MSKNTNSVLRKRLFVDPEVQGQLVLRVVLYWATCLMTVAMVVMCWRIVNGPARPFYRHLDDMWFHLGPALLASLILLPMVIMDVIRVSNRFVGPLLRLRRSLRNLASGQEVEPIRFRQGDFWQGFADEFNAVITRMKELEIAAYRTMEVGDDQSDQAKTLVHPASVPSIASSNNQLTPLDACLPPSPVGGSLQTSST